jgi:hypothetical protein
MMKYFTTASKKGRVRYGQISWTIGVGESDGFPMPVGQANQVGKTADGPALWRLTVHGAEVPGRLEPSFSLQWNRSSLAAMIVTQAVA